ncbi:MAG: hypothetical protein ABI414_01920 [Devosia sp.]
MTKLWAVIAFSALALELTSPAMAQQVPSQNNVRDICRDVAFAELDNGDANPLRGQCIAITEGYLTNVLQNTPPAALDQTLSDLVVVLANLLFTPECRVGSEIAQAIAITSLAATDPEQEAQIDLIYQTVKACDFAITAGIITIRGNTFAPESSDRGVSASQN